MKRALMLLMLCLSLSVSFGQIDQIRVKRLIASEQPWIDVTSKLAKGNDLLNDTAAFTNAIAALPASGGTIFVPAGTFYADLVSVPSNTTILGMGPSSIIRPYTSTSGYILGANSGASNVFVENVTLRNIKLYGPVETAGFGEHYHLVNFSGVKHLLVDSVHFVGMRGDGLYIGSGTAGQERHNIDVQIRNSVFDGVVKDNRNGISIIDCDGLTIDGSYFTRLSKSTMPGAIDIEPDSAAYHIVRNISVTNNHITDCNGNIAAIALIVPAAVTAYPYNVSFTGNTIDGNANGLGIYVNLFRNPTETSNISIRGNTIKGAYRPMQIQGVRGLVISGNLSRQCIYSYIIGYLTEATTSVHDVVFSDNILYGPNTTDAYGLQFGFVTGLQIRGNIFKDLGPVTGGGCAIRFMTTATTDRVTISENIFRSPLGYMASAIITSGTTSAATNIFSNNQLNSMLHDFPAYRTDDPGTRINTFDDTVLPSGFLPGRSMAVINTSGTWPGSYTQGTVITEQPTNKTGYTGWTTQYFIPRYLSTTPGALTKNYVRKSVKDSDTWSDWARMFGEFLAATFVWDPGSLDDGVGETKADITATGAEIGDYIIVSPPYDLQGITCTAYVSAANTVSVRLQNETTGTIDLASATWTLTVIKRI